MSDLPVAIDRDNTQLSGFAGVESINLSPQVRELLGFVPLKENFGSDWVVTLPPLPKDTLSQEYSDVLAIHQVFRANKKADKYDCLSLLLSNPQALKQYAAERGEPVEEVLAETRHKAIKMGFPFHPETNEFDLEYLKNQQEKARQRQGAVTREVVNLLTIMEAKRQSMAEFEPQFRQVAERYEQIDRRYHPESNNDEWKIARLNASGGKVVHGTDVDLTLTIRADHIQYLAGSHMAESLLKTYTREAFPVAFVRYWQEALKKIPDVFARVGQRIEFRPGVWQFFEMLHEQNQPDVIMSANFAPIIKGVLQRLPQRGIQAVHAVEPDDISAIDKKTVLRELVVTNPDRAAVIYEDGESGLPLTDDDVSPLVACYFALEGSSFHKALVQKRLPHYAFRDFNDNIQVLKRAGIFH